MVCDPAKDKKWTSVKKDMQDLDLKVNNLKNSKKKTKKLVRGTINSSASESSVQLHCQLTGSSVILTHSIRAQA